MLTASGPARQSARRCPLESEDRGAAAVEFALVVPLLIALLLAIIDFGLWFSDSIGVRHGASEGARIGIVTDFSTYQDCDPPTSESPAKKTACITKERIGGIGGDPVINVSVTDDKWEEGATLLVCAAVKETGLTGFTPLPDDGILRTRVKMRVAVTNTPTTDAPEYQTDDDPGGDDWAWCV